MVDNLERMYITMNYQSTDYNHKPRHYLEEPKERKKYMPSRVPNMFGQANNKITNE